MGSDESSLVSNSRPSPRKQSLAKTASWSGIPKTCPSAEAHFPISYARFPSSWRYGRGRSGPPAHITITISQARANPSSNNTRLSILANISLNPPTDSRQHAPFPTSHRRVDGLPRSAHQTNAQTMHIVFLYALSSVVRVSFVLRCVRRMRVVKSVCPSYSSCAPSPSRLDAFVPAKSTEEREKNKSSGANEGHTGPSVFCVCVCVCV